MCVPLQLLSIHHPLVVEAVPLPGQWFQHDMGSCISHSMRQLYSTKLLSLLLQDVLHRVSTPSQVTGKRPRYSLVWKLVFIPRHQGQQCCIAKPSWGPPTDLGSAAKVATVKRSLLLKRKAGAVES